MLEADSMSDQKNQKKQQSTDVRPEFEGEHNNDLYKLHNFLMSYQRADSPASDTQQERDEDDAEDHSVAGNKPGEVQRQPTNDVDKLRNILLSSSRSDSSVPDAEQKNDSGKKENSDEEELPYLNCIEGWSRFDKQGELVTTKGNLGDFKNFLCAQNFEATTVVGKGILDDEDSRERFNEEETKQTERWGEWAYSGEENIKQLIEEQLEKNKHSQLPKVRQSEPTTPQQDFEEAIKIQNKKNVKQLLKNYSELLTTSNVVSSFQFSLHQDVCELLKRKLKREHDETPWQDKYIAFLEEVQKQLSESVTGSSKKSKLLVKVKKYLVHQIQETTIDKEKKQDKSDLIGSGGLDLEKEELKQKNILRAVIQKVCQDIRVSVGKLKEKHKGNKSLKSKLGGWETAAEQSFSLSELDCTLEKLQEYKNKLEQLQTKIASLKLPQKNEQKSLQNNRWNNRRNRRPHRQEQKAKTLPKPKTTHSKHLNPGDLPPEDSDNSLVKPTQSSKEKKHSPAPKQASTSTDTPPKVTAYQPTPIDQLYIALMYLATWHSSLGEEKSIEEGQKKYSNLVGLNYLKDLLRAVVLYTQHIPTNFKIVSEVDQGDFRNLLRKFDWVALDEEIDLLHLARETIEKCFDKDGLVDKLLHHLKGRNSPTCAWSEQQLATLYMAIKKRKPLPSDIDMQAATAPTSNYLLRETPLFKALERYSSTYNNTDPLSINYLSITPDILAQIVQLYRQHCSAIEEFHEAYLMGSADARDWTSISRYLPTVHILEQLSAMIQLCGGYIAPKGYGEFTSFMQKCKQYTNLRVHDNFPEINVAGLLSLCKEACQVHDRMLAQWKSPEQSRPPETSSSSSSSFSQFTAFSLFNFDLPGNGVWMSSPSPSSPPSSSSSSVSSSTTTYPHATNPWGFMRSNPSSFDKTKPTATIDKDVATTELTFPAAGSSLGKKEPNEVCEYRRYL